MALVFEQTSFEWAVDWWIRIMGINAIPREEGGKVLAQVVDPTMVLSRATNKQLSRTRLLKYLVP